MIQNADPSSIVTSRAHPSRRHFRARPATSRPTHALNTSHMSLTVSLSARAAVPRAARVVRTPRGAVALARAAADASASADAVAPRDVEGDAPAAMGLIDPADGSIAEAAPLGDDNALLERAMVAFTDSRAVEVINGRAAMVGWMLALSAEIDRHTSLWGQLFNTRTFTLADGVSRTSTYPGSGFFLVPLVVVAALGASLAPTLKKSSPNGLDETPEAFGPFKPEAELTNGRGAMVGLVSLLVVEHFTKGALFGFF